MSTPSMSPGVPSNSVSSESNNDRKNSRGVSGQHVYKYEAMTTRSKDADFVAKKCQSPTDANDEWIFSSFKKASLETRKRPSSSLSNQDTSTKENEKEIVLPPPPFKKRKIGQDYVHDYYCWICHREGTSLQCELCPRVYHLKCVNMQERPRDWVCLECEKITLSQCTDTQSKAMAMLSLDQLAYLLKCALSRMKHSGADAFLKPVSLDLFPMYDQYVFNPMDLSTLDKNIKKKLYGSTEEFLADAKWIIHNCIVFNGYHHKLTSSARTIVKICRHEMSEIEVCPDCYMNSCTKKENWFCEPCREPHILVWAKLQGFPFWPAKALRAANGSIDVRFFGAHDRAWIPDIQCYLLSKNLPTPLKSKKKSGFEHSMEELEIHIHRLRETYGHFEYAPFRTPFDPDNPLRQVNPTRRCSDFAKKNNTPGKKTKPLCRTVKVNQVSLPKFSPKDIFVKTEAQNKLDDGSVTLNKTKCSPKKNESSDIKSRSSRMNFSSGAVSSQRNSTEDFVSQVKLVSLLKTKNIPSGVFESDKLDNNFKSLELNIPTLDKSKISKPSLENIKKLEVLTTTADDDEEEEDSEITFKTKESISIIEKVLEDSQSKSQSLPVSIEDIKVEGNETDVEVASLSNDMSLQLMPQKKNSLFSIQLDKTIESCKAKLGIHEITDSCLETNESEEEEEQKCFESENEDESKTVNEVHITEGESGSKLDSPVSDYQTNVNSNLENCTKSETVSGDKIWAHDISKERLLSEDLSEGQSKISSMLTDGKKTEEEQLKHSISIKSQKNSPVHDGLIAASSEITDNKNTNDLDESLHDQSLESQVHIISSPSSLDLSNSVSKKILTPVEKLAAHRSTLNIMCEPESDLMIDLSDKASISNSELSEATKPNENQSELLNASCDSLTGFTIKNQSDGSILSLKNVSEAANAKVQISKISELTIGDQYSAAMPSMMDFSKYTDRVLSFVKNTFEEMIQDFFPLGGQTISDHDVLKALQQEVERMKWYHQQQLAETRHNSDLTILEMRTCMEAEKQQMLADLRRQLEEEKLQVIKDTKKKQWCTYCGSLAQFYCCWNTSYCDYPCQQADWPQHMLTCTQTQSTENLEIQTSETTEKISDIISAHFNDAVNSTKKEVSIGNSEESSPKLVMVSPSTSTNSHIQFVQTNSVTSTAPSTSPTIQVQYVTQPLSSPSTQSGVQTITFTEVPKFSPTVSARAEASGQIVPTLLQTQPVVASQGKVLYPVLPQQINYTLPKIAILPLKTYPGKKQTNVNIKPKPS